MKRGIRWAKVTWKSQRFFGGPGFHRRDEVGHELGQIALDVLDRHFASLDLGKIEDVIDQLQEVLGVPTYRVNVFRALRGGLDGPQEQIGESDDGGQRGADLMAHVRQELALGAAGGFGRRCSFGHTLLKCFV